MKTFKTFLEAKAGGSAGLVYEPLTAQPAPYYLDKYCQDSFWMLTKKAPLFRGIQRKGLDVSFVDLTQTTRKSQNTSNWYTEIFDNHPEMQDFPKRSKSMVCSNSYDYARGFGDEVYAIFPVKNSKIGLVPESDIWEISVNLFGKSLDINVMNKFLAQIIIIGLNTDLCTFEILKQFGDQIKHEDGEVYQRIKNSRYSGLLDNGEFVNNFLGAILEAYSPDKLGLKTFTPATLSTAYSPYHEHEVWFDTGAIVIPLNKWHEMVSAYKKSNRDIRSWQDLLEVMKNENI